MSKADLDKFFPRNGACMFHPTRYARHRLVGAIRDRYRAGDSICVIAADMNLSREAIKAAVSSTPDDSRMTPNEVRQGKKAGR